MLSKLFKSNKKSQTENKSLIKSEAIITQVQKPKKASQKSKGLQCFGGFLSAFTRTFTLTKKNSLSYQTASYLLPQQSEKVKGRKTLLLDLDETLVHSTFDPVEQPDIILPMIIDQKSYSVNVLKRPGVDEFLNKVCEIYEVIVFTASIQDYAEPLMKILDPQGKISHILYRDSCTRYKGSYVKDLARLGRNLKDVIIVDNSPCAFMFQPENAYQINNFFDDKLDIELERLFPFLEYLLKVNDVRAITEHQKTFEKLHPTKSKSAEFKQKTQVEKITRQTSLHERIQSLNLGNPVDPKKSGFRPGEVEALRIIQNLTKKQSFSIAELEKNNESIQVSSISTLDRIDDRTSSTADSRARLCDTPPSLNYLEQSETTPEPTSRKSQFSGVKGDRLDKRVNKMKLKLSANNQEKESPEQLFARDASAKKLPSENGSSFFKDLFKRREALNVNLPCSNEEFKKVASKERV